MLKNNLVQAVVELKLHGYLIGVEVEPGTDLEDIENSLKGSLIFKEGVGNVDITYMGEIAQIDEPMVEEDLSNE